MQHKKQSCLGCRHFRLVNVDTGLCRIDKDLDRNYPEMDKNNHCPRWRDCGQQYYIRLGWLKARTSAEKA